MKRIFIFFISFFSLVCANAIPEVKVYSNGDYGLSFDGTIPLNNSTESIPERSIVDEDGNLYMSAFYKGGVLPNGDILPSSPTDAVLKFSSSGECVWAKAVKNVRKLMEFDDHLLLAVSVSQGEVFVYDGVSRKISGNFSVFLLKISKENGKLLKEIEIEMDNVESSGQGSFPFALSNYCGMSVSADGDLWFILDVKPEFKRLNEQTPVTIKRFGDNDKCFVRLSSDLEFKQAFGIGSDADDEMDFFKGESPRLVQNLIFVGDTLFCHIPFGGDEMNISFDESNPVIVKKKTGWRCVASAALCKYLLKDDKLELLNYRVINENDNQAKRFFVNSKNQVIVSVPYVIWDKGEETYYMLNPDLSFRELESYPYNTARNCGSQKSFRFDKNFNILRFEDYDFIERKYSSDLEELPNPGDNSFRCAKYDINENLHWVFDFPSLDDYPYTPECNADPERGFLYLCFYANVNVDIDMSEAINEKNNERVIARYIETYRIKTSSEHVSIVVNDGNDMVRHGSDAEVVISAEKGYHVESVKTSKGENVEVSWNGRCSIKNVTEPVELIITTGLGENSVDQTDAVALSVYPNPVKDLLNVDDADDASFEIIDLSGNIVCSGVVNDGKIVTSELSEGVYVLTINKEIGAYSTKIVKK